MALVRYMLDIHKLSLTKPIQAALIQWHYCHEACWLSMVL